MIDLMSAVQAAVFAALEANVPAETAEVFDSVPEGKLGTYLQVGDIDSENDGDKDDQRERFEVGVNGILLGKDRGALMTILHAARVALEGQALEHEGVSFSAPAFLGTAVSATPARAADRLVYAGTSLFEIYAEPA